MSAFESIMEGLTQAGEYSKGNQTGSKIHQVKIARVDIVQVRTKTGLSQADFAKTIGVAKGTLVNWEQGRRKPSGPARVLLALIAKNPNAIQELEKNQ